MELEAVGTIVPLCDVVADGGRLTGDGDLTVFKAMGVGLGDLALGAEVLTRSSGGGYGRPIAAPQRAIAHLKEAQ